MMSLAPEEGANMQRQFTQDQRATQQFDQESEKAGYESKLRGYDTVSRELRGATPENWGQKRSYLVQEGLLDEQDMSPVFDPQNQESLLNRSFSEGEAVANEFKQKGYDLNVDKQKEAVRHNKATEGISKAAQFAQQKTAEMKAKKAEASLYLTPGEKKSDEVYAADYNEYTDKGRTNAISTIEKLKELQMQVAADTGFGEAGGTRFEAITPDFMRTRLAIERRDDARNFANKTLKALFGGQL